MIAPLQCAHCNAPLLVVDAPTLVCRHCGTINQIPEAYHEELRLARDLDQADVAGTRGWYDQAFEAVNFVAPLFVALMFVAVEVIVLGVSFH
ncbi:MAG: hypothetical protein V7638_2444 [Acidobacteriota bacterium]|jgi:phage FluMu protein Com